MKKSLVLMAMAGVALASCVNDVADVAQKEQEKVKIGFTAPLLYDNAQSRANVFQEFSDTRDDFESYSYPKAEDFVVFSNVYEGNFTGWDVSKNYWGDGVPSLYVSYNSTLNGWVNSTKDYYWPDGGKALAFAAYSPADMRPFSSYTDKDTYEVEKENGTDFAQPVINYGPTGLSIKGFKVADNPAYQFELLYSKRSLGNTFNLSSGAGEYAGTPIAFQHALSSIHFAIQKDANVTATITLRKIVIKGLKNKGDFAEGLSETGYSESSEYVATPSWSNQTGTIEYVAYDAENTKGVEFPTNAADHVYDASKQITGDTAYMLLVIPQSLTGVDNRVTLEVTYAVDGSKKNPVTVTLGDEQGTDKSNNSVTVDKWEPGTKYTYNLHYSSDAAAKDKIIFAPETGDWKEVRHIVINLGEGE